MVKTKILSIFYWIAIIAADIFIYMLLGLLQLDYEDTWNPSKGELWSSESMTKWQLIFSYALLIWNVVNLFAILFIARKVYIRLRYNY
jgi:hypothetical protein